MAVDWTDIATVIAPWWVKRNAGTVNSVYTVFELPVWARKIRVICPAQAMRISTEAADGAAFAAVTDFTVVPANTPIDINIARNDLASSNRAPTIAIGPEVANAAIECVIQGWIG